MDITLQTRGGVNVAVITGDEVLLRDGACALELLAQVWYDMGCNRLVLSKELVAEEFFDLKTQIAGEVLQKFSNYRGKLAIYGCFDCYDSKALRDFIRECNRGQNVFFVDTQEQAVTRLAEAL